MDPLPGNCAPVQFEAGPAAPVHRDADLDSQSGFRRRRFQAVPPVHPQEHGAVCWFRGPAGRGANPPSVATNPRDDIDLAEWPALLVTTHVAHDAGFPALPIGDAAGKRVACGCERGRARRSCGANHPAGGPSPSAPPPSPSPRRRRCTRWRGRASGRGSGGPTAMSRGCAPQRRRSGGPKRWRRRGR